MLPVLRIASQGETTVPKAAETLGIEFGLTPEQMARMIPSGGTPLIHNRAHWAKTYLVKAGLLDQPRRGVFRITPRGLDLMKQNPQRIDNECLAKYPEFLEFKKRRPSSGEERTRTGADNAFLVETPPAPLPPNERIAVAAKEIGVALRDDLLNRIFSIEPMPARALNGLSSVCFSPWDTVAAATNGPSIPEAGATVAWTA
jgi:restriction system protein